MNKKEIFSFLGQIVDFVLTKHDVVDIPRRVGDEHIVACDFDQTTAMLPSSLSASRVDSWSRQPTVSLLLRPFLMLLPDIARKQMLQIVEFELKTQPKQLTPIQGHCVTCRRRDGRVVAVVQPVNELKQCAHHFPEVRRAIRRGRTVRCDTRLVDHVRFMAIDPCGHVTRYADERD